MVIFPVGDFSDISPEGKLAGSVNILKLFNLPTSLIANDTFGIQKLVKN